MIVSQFLFGARQFLFWAFEILLRLFKLDLKPRQNMFVLIDHVSFARIQIRVFFFKSFDLCSLCGDSLLWTLFANVGV